MAVSAASANQGGRPSSSLRRCSTCIKRKKGKLCRECLAWSGADEAAVGAAALAAPAPEAAAAGNVAASSTQRRARQATKRFDDEVAPQMRRKATGKRWRASAAEADAENQEEGGRKKSKSEAGEHAGEEGAIA